MCVVWCCRGGEGEVHVPGEHAQHALRLRLRVRPQRPAGQLQQPELRAQAVPGLLHRPRHARPRRQLPPRRSVYYLFSVFQLSFCLYSNSTVDSNKSTLFSIHLHSSPFKFVSNTSQNKNSGWRLKVNKDEHGILRSCMNNSDK